MRTRVISIVWILTLCAGVSLATQVDQDVGSATQAVPGQTSTRDVLCLSPYYFGGSTSSFSGTDRLRGNIFTVTATQTLTEITVELDFTGTANLYFYVLEAPTITSTYTVVSETLVPSASAGQSYYTSGGISVPLNPGIFYAIGVAWGPETVTYVRDTATLPRPWALGTVEATAQGSSITPPISGPVTINPFAGAEYSMTLCFGPIPVELQSFSID